MPSLARFVPLVLPCTPEHYDALRSVVLPLVLADAEVPVAIGLHDVATLDVSTISALIRLNREVRERGGSLALAGANANVRQTLRVTALERVFRVLDGPGDAAGPVSAPAPSPRRPRRIAGVVLALAAAVSLLGGRPALAASPVTAPLAPERIVERVIAQNPDMRTYEAQLVVDMHLKTFPWLSQHLDATTYYKRPNNFEVVFHNVPSYARGFEKLYSDIDDPSGWDRRFTMTVAGEREVAGHRDVVIRLVQRVRGMIDHQDVAIDPARWTIDQMEWHYYNGGLISMSQEFSTAGSFTVLVAQHATIRVPHVSASAEARYSGYRTNVAIDDAVFAKSSGQEAR